MTEEQQPASVSAGGVTVGSSGELLLQARDAVLADAARDALAAAIVGKDATVWGAEAAAEASVRLGWLDCTRVSRPLVAELESLRGELAASGVDRVVLAGMGGSSLAPEVITSTYGVDLPHQPGTQACHTMKTNLRRSVLLAALTLATSPLTLHAQEALRVVTDAPFPTLEFVKDV